VARHVFSCQLRWSDMDAFGHVNNVVFLQYLQEARVDMLLNGAAETGAGMLAAGIVVVRQEIDYRKPLVFRLEPVHVECWISHLGTSSFTIAYRVRDAEDTYADAASVLVPYDLASGRPRRISSAERAVLETFIDSA
jgi:acyl-CoA thioester hydrolase